MKRKQIKEAEFKKIKSLQVAGLSVRLVHKVINRSVGSIHYIFKAKTLADFKADCIRRRNLKIAEKQKKIIPPLVRSPKLEIPQPKPEEKPSNLIEEEILLLKQIRNVLVRLLLTEERKEKFRKQQLKLIDNLI